MGSLSSPSEFLKKTGQPLAFLLLATTVLLPTSTATCNFTAYLNAYFCVSAFSRGGPFPEEGDTFEGTIWVVVKKYGLLLGPLNTSCGSLRTPEGTMILTTTHMLNLYPYLHLYLYPL